MTYHIRPDQINLLLLGFSDQKLGRATKRKEIIKWEWLETIIELHVLHSFVDRRGVHVFSDSRAYLAWHYCILHEERKKDPGHCCSLAFFTWLTVYSQVYC